MNYLVVDGKIPARNALILLSKGNKEPTLPVSYINCYPIKVGDFKIITPDEVLVKDNGVWNIKNDADKEVKNFYNIQLTNHFNAFLTMLDNAWVDDYVNDINDVLTESKKDQTLLDILTRFTNGIDNMVKMFEEDDKYMEDVESLMPGDAVTAVYARNVVSHYISHTEIPTNKYLEEMRPLVIKSSNDPTVTNLFERFERDIGNDNAFHVYIDDADNEYCVIRKNSYYIIRKLSMDHLFKLNKYVMPVF